MAYRNSIEERIFILEKSFQGDAPSAKTEFAARFPGRVPPSKQAIHALKKKLRESGSVCDAKKSGRSVSVRSPQNRKTVAQFYHENHSTSQVRARFQLQISQTSLQRIMKNLLLRLWRPQLVHALNEDDFDCRFQFCKWCVNVTIKDPSMEDGTLWSDEATFNLNGQVNRHNSVYCAEANPHLLMEGKKFNVLEFVSGQLFEVTVYWCPISLKIQSAVRRILRYCVNFFCLSCRMRILVRSFLCRMVHNHILRILFALSRTKRLQVG